MKTFSSRPLAERTVMQLVACKASASVLGMPLMISDRLSAPLAHGSPWEASVTSSFSGDIG